jgi:hypothetical protein
MTKLAQLQQDRAAKVIAQKTLIDTRNAENREFTETEQTEFRTLDTQVQALDSKIIDEQAVETAQARAAALDGVTIPGSANRGEAAEKAAIHGKASIIAAIRSRLSGKELTGAEAELDAIGRAENRAAGVTTPDSAAIVIPLGVTRATQHTVTQDAGEYGGQLVTASAPVLQDPFMPKLFVEELGATFFSGLSAGDVPLPNANNFNMEWLAEGASVTGQKQKFVGPSLSAKRAAASASITNSLINQASVGVEEYVRNLLGQAGSRILNGAAINGGGGVAPTGILNTTGVLTGSSSAAAVATHDLLVQLESLVDSADASDVSRGWLMHPKVRAALMTIKKDAGSGRFLLELIDQLMGYRYVSTNLVPTLDDGGTAVYPLIYGDFSQLFVGQWGAMSIAVDPYTELAADSVRLVANLYADVAIAKPTAFAKNAFIRGI